MNTEIGIWEIDRASRAGTKLGTAELVETEEMLEAVQTTLVCEDRDVMVEVTDVLLALQATEDVEQHQRARVGEYLMHRVRAGECVLLDAGDRAHVANLPDLPPWLVRVRLDGQTKDWWGVLPAIIDRKQEPHLDGAS